jgi:hypothetical protein
MDNFKNYLNIVLETLGWQRPEKATQEHLDFLNDIDKAAKTHGYEAVSFGENENNRIVKFSKTTNRLAKSV